MSRTPLLNGQVIGLALYSTRAVLSARLAELGTSFEPMAVLNLLVQHHGSWGRADLVDRLVFTLKIDEAAAQAVVDGVIASGLAEPAPGDTSTLRLTDRGAALQSRAAEVAAAIASRIYADIPEEELAVAGRVLALLTDRANAELSAVHRAR
ncbi:MarR family transcriptional regulator [Streptomyces sp. VRA16 Mangrove soil]|uniref:MarR family transcriptional regulator n=1 Tax=Streptomyces sp. VRA16 Mangrove soil TaxID=2817434 RepID=UPI001A9FF336|nr:MarR family transcriptional regulator [Streptomyces sp. VRA16 Mangrove soil]MBO1336927.1 MarR family transcriptional regulator [Streptomyces sp. VRA16 Mangrove soil]